MQLFNIKATFFCRLVTINYVSKFLRNKSVFFALAIGAMT